MFSPILATTGGGDLNITATLGTATANGFTANVDQQQTIAGIIGAASASGLLANIDRQLTIAGILGTAAADGYTASVGYGDLNITATLGTAVSDGFVASVDRQLTIACAIGQVTASGFDATVAEVYTLTMTVQQARRLEAVIRLHGLIDPLTVSVTARGDGTVVQTLSGTGPVTVTTTGLPATGLPTVAMLDSLARWYGLIDPIVEQDASRSDGILSQTVVTIGGTTTVTTL